MPNKSSVCPHSIEKQEMQRNDQVPFPLFCMQQEVSEEAAPTEGDINSAGLLELVCRFKGVGMWINLLLS